MPHATRRHRRNRSRKSRVGSFPTGSIVAVKQDPYSPMILTNVNTAMNVMEASNPRFGGARRSRSRRRARTQKRRLH